MTKRVFLIVLDSFGIGGAPDAGKFGDEGSNTLAAVLSFSDAPYPNLSRMGLLAIDGEDDMRITAYKKAQESIPCPIGSYARVREISAGKDSTIGHWELAGIISDKPQPTYPVGFPEEVIKALEQATGKEFLCNKPYSGTDVIRDYGEEHMKTGKPIIYTSADSVLQIAAHEEIIPLDELYSICKKAREVMTGEHAVGRVIARPFVGEPGNFARTANRHDFSLAAPSSTMLDLLKSEGFDVISIGKIYDLFAGRGLTESNPTKSNTDGINKTIAMMDRDFNGLCFTNLVDFDMKYGHRNDIEGYATAMHEFDDALPRIYRKVFGMDFEDPEWIPNGNFGKEEWDILKQVCQDVCPDEELSFEMMHSIIDTENAASGMHQRSTVLDDLQHVIGTTFYRNEKDALEYYTNTMTRKKVLGGRYNEKFLDYAHEEYSPEEAEESAT